ncbi:hypothetical protein [Thalassobacillus devorans]|uniref:hypothetical protein n=1 Tax=Thalassobacillus devorans TaxID=279813 RepID=UPI000A1CAC3C|nr:hypothetical protein [Thalassobacillus devorans]
MIYKKSLYNFFLVTYIFSIIFIWSSYPLISDIIGLISLVLFIIYYKDQLPKRLNIIFLYLAPLYIAALISLELDNILYLLRYTMHILVAIIVFITLKRNILYRSLYTIQFLVLPIGFVFTYFLSIEDPINLYTLGYGLFTGAKNHFAYFVIGNYLFLTNFSSMSKKSNILLLIITIVEVVLSRSATGIIAFSFVLIILGVKNVRSLSVGKILRVFMYIISITLILSFFMKRLEVFNKILLNNFNRIKGLATDESWELRTNFLFEKFNNAILNGSFKDFLIGRGNFEGYLGLPFDNSYYALFVGGGFLSALAVVSLLVLNIFTAKNNKLYPLLIIGYSLIFFITANIMFEIQNSISFIMFLFPLLNLRKNDSLLN